MPGRRIPWWLFMKGTIQAPDFGEDYVRTGNKKPKPWGQMRSRKTGKKDVLWKDPVTKAKLFDHHGLWDNGSQQRSSAGSGRHSSRGSGSRAEVPDHDDGIGGAVPPPGRAQSQHSRHPSRSSNRSQRGGGPAYGMGRGQQPVQFAGVGDGSTIRPENSGQSRNSTQLTLGQGRNRATGERSNIMPPPGLNASRSASRGASLGRGRPPRQGQGPGGMRGFPPPPPVVRDFGAEAPNFPGSQRNPRGGAGGTGGRPSAGRDFTGPFNDFLRDPSRRPR